jgi:hypothetical protein
MNRLIIVHQDEVRKGVPVEYIYCGRSNGLMTQTGCTYPAHLAETFFLFLVPDYIYEKLDDQYKQV